LREQYGNNYGSCKKKLQYMNLTDSCPAQLLRRLKFIADNNGGDISRNQIDYTLMNLLVSRFGSFNKAKQLINLATREKSIAVEKQFILEDMVAFYRKYKRWPTKNDYERKSMICSYTPIERLGHIKVVRQEAMQLKDEQDKRNNINIRQMADKIEMEYAGRARR